MFYLYRKSSGQVLSVSVNSFGTLDSDLEEYSTNNPAPAAPLKYNGNALVTATAEDLTMFQEKAEEDALLKYKDQIQSSVSEGTRLDVLALLKTIAQVSGQTENQVTTIFNAKLDEIV